MSAGTEAESDEVAWWRLWAVAALAHVLANSTFEFAQLGVTNTVLGLFALALVVQPRRRSIRVAVLVGILVSLWVEAPFLGNHWLLAALASLVALAARPWRDGWLARASPGLRLTLLTFYSFAAFAKLNTGFFDSTTSCAPYFANQNLRFWHLPQISTGGSLALATAILSATIEVSVPILLAVPVTRRVGVTLAVIFHSIIALDLGQHFFDFTLVLVPLFLLFTPPGVLTDIDRWWRRVTAFLTRRAAMVVIGWAVAVIVTTMLPSATASSPSPESARGSRGSASGRFWSSLSSPNRGHAQPCGGHRPWSRASSSSLPLSMACRPTSV
ncbi:MAG: hypothetical protein R2706_18000 [Acidimicrobiales bacterium]